MARFFNALNGRELIELLVTEVRKELEQDDYFDPSTTYPILKYSIKFEIDAYPVAKPHKELECEGAVCPGGDPEQMIEQGEVEKKAIKKAKTVKREVDVPDLARQMIKDPDLTANSPINHPSEALHGTRKVGK